MALVCTIGATMTCAHFAVITLTGKGNIKFTVAGVAVLTDLSILGAAVIACPYAPGGSASPCSAVDTAEGSEILTMDNGASGVILANSAITTLNADTNSYDVVITAPGQSILTSI